VARQGWEGWDEYAPFYDWENAQTLGRRDVPFWRRVATQADGDVLELGCGTGRVTLPLAKAGVRIVGIDRSEPMLARARRRETAVLRRLGAGHRATAPRSVVPQRPGRQRFSTRAVLQSATSRSAGSTSAARVQFVRGDIRRLPFVARRFAMVLAPYGILQSLLRDRDLTSTLESVVRVLRKGGTFGIDLVPDVPKWREYENRVQLRGKTAGGAHLTLIESVRQDPRQRLTTFEQRYVERRRSGPPVDHRFALTFRTLTVPEMTRRLERTGFAVQTIIGDYRGRPWDERADVWIILAKKV